MLFCCVKVCDVVFSFAFLQIVFSSVHCVFVVFVVWLCCVVQHVCCLFMYLLLVFQMYTYFVFFILICLVYIYIYIYIYIFKCLPPSVMYIIAFLFVFINGYCLLLMFFSVVVVLYCSSFVNVCCFIVFFVLFTVCKFHHSF